jgi:hypothetical protein
MKYYHRGFCTITLAWNGPTLIGKEGLKIHRQDLKVGLYVQQERFQASKDWSLYRYIGLCDALFGWG